MSARIASSLRGQMRALASQGIFATDCYGQLRAVLLQKLGPEHAALLAEPQHDAEGRHVDWYAEGNGPARPVAELPEADARLLRAKAADLARDIKALSDDLTEEAQSRHALSGHLLQLAIQHPAAEDLWAVDGKPVLINWGFAPGAAGAQPQDLSRLGAALPPPPPPEPASISTTRGGCLPWLLPLCLLLLLLWLLLSALGILPSPLPASCFKSDAAALEAQKNRAAKLDDELAGLLQQLRERAALCKPVTPPEAVKEPQAKPAEPEIVEPFLGETPVQPAKPDTPKVTEQPEKKAPVPEPPRPEKPKPRKNEDLTIPRDAAKKKDLAFLEGCWTSETGLYAHPSNEPIIAEYCFDKNGKGRRFVRERNGQMCSGSATARFSGNRLLFDADSARCPRGGTYVPQKVECAGSENRTQCKGRELGGARHKWDARFRRK